MSPACGTQVSHLQETESTSDPYYAPGELTRSGDATREGPTLNESVGAAEGDAMWMPAGACRDWDAVWATVVAPTEAREVGFEAGGWVPGQMAAVLGGKGDDTCCVQLYA